jgi:hypothetical protein
MAARTDGRKPGSLSHHEHNVRRWTTLPADGWEGKQLKYVERLGRYIDLNVESDECVFCGAPIDPETAYHNTICRRCA